MLNRPPFNGDLLMVEARQGRNDDIWKVVEVDTVAQTVKLQLFSEVVADYRRFYKNSQRFRTETDYNLKNRYTENLEAAYRLHMLRAQKEWRDGLPNLKEYVT